jgi:hypothetical protein
MTVKQLIEELKKYDEDWDVTWSSMHSSGKIDKVQKSWREKEIVILSYD